MKIFVLTNELSEKHGYGRYSMDLVNALRNEGIDVIIAEGLPGHLSYKSNYFLAFLHALRLRKQAKSCDIIHSFIEPYSYIAYMLSKLTGKRYFVTAHGTFGVLPYSFPAYKKYFHKKSFDNAEKIICVSNYTRNRLLKFSLKNLKVINNGIDLKKFYPKSPRSFKERKNIILSVGALKHRKGYHVSIPAFAKARDRFNDLQYYIVGNQDDVTYFERLKQLTHRLSLGDSVKFLDSVTHDDLIRLYTESRIFILTPVSEGNNFEGFGLVYLEAGVFGLPVIGSRDSGAEDAIKEGETGFLVPQNAPEQTSEALIKVLENDVLYGELADNGVVWAKDHDWSIIVKSYVGVYKSL